MVLMIVTHYHKLQNEDFKKSKRPSAYQFDILIEEQMSDKIQKKN